MEDINEEKGGGSTPRHCRICVDFSSQNVYAFPGTGITVATVLSRSILKLELEIELELSRADIRVLLGLLVNLIQHRHRYSVMDAEISKEGKSLLEVSGIGT